MLDTITPVNDVFRRDVEVDDPTILNPTEADALEAGEWLQLDTTSGRGIRVASAAVLNVMQVFSQRGDFAAQAIDKVAVLQLHEYEAETDMFRGADTFAINDLLTVEQFAIDTVTRAALTIALTGEVVHAICTRTPQDNGGHLRYTKVSPFIAP